MKKIIIIIALFTVTCINIFGQTDTTKNIEMFGRIWGYLKFYHPTVQRGKIDWDIVFLQNYSKFKYSDNSNTFNLLLDSLLNIVGDVKKLSVPYKYWYKDTTVNNLNFNWIEKYGIINPVNKERLYNITKYYKPHRNKYFISEYCSYSGIEVYKPPYTQAPDESHSVLAFFNYWNRINYCFAYKYLMDYTWDQTLDEYLPKFVNTYDNNAFYFLLANLTTRINDGHGFYYSRFINQYLGMWMFFKVDFINNKIIVSEISDSIATILNLHVGDEILEINKEPILIKR